MSSGPNVYRRLKKVPMSIDGARMKRDEVFGHTDSLTGNWIRWPIPTKLLQQIATLFQFFCKNDATSKSEYKNKNWAVAAAELMNVFALFTFSSFFCCSVLKTCCCVTNLIK